MMFQNECIAKIQNDTEMIEGSVNLKYSFLATFIRVTQKIREQGSLKNLDSILAQTCIPAADEDVMYEVMTKLVKICFEQEDTFTPEEKLLVKEKLDQIFCNVYMKLGK